VVTVSRSTVDRITVEVIHGDRRSGRTTAALNWLKESRFGLYVTSDLRALKRAQEMGGKHPGLKYCCVRMLKEPWALRGCHFDRVVLDNRDFYFLPDWWEAEPLMRSAISSKSAFIVEIRENPNPS